MTSPRAGQPAAAEDLVDVARLVTAYYAVHPDPGDAAQRVAFGTSGHRGSALTATFNEDHILARLDPAERAAFAERGRAFAAELAERIAYSPRTYWPRNITGPLQDKTGEAIMTHQRETGTGPVR